MTKVAEWEWTAQDTPPETPTPARKQWRMLVAEVAADAKQALPQCNGRIDKAVQIVLNDDVVLLEDGRATVGSQSDAGLHYVVNGECECKDSDKAPSGWCKHKLAAAIYKQAIARAQEQREQEEGPYWQSNQAPSSVTLKWQVGDIELMLTLRDSTR